MVLQSAGLRVVVIEDEPLARTALQSLLTDGGVEVAGCAETGKRGISTVLEVAPDVALVDLGLPDMSGVEVTREIGTHSPATRVLVVTASDAHEDVVDAIRAGATGYLLKEAAESEIVEAVRAVARDEPILSKRIASRLFALAREAPVRDRNGTVDTAAALTARELEILRLIAEGKDNTEIASELSVSPFTVKNHVSNILGKLQLQNRIQAAVHAVRVGLA